MSSRESTPIIVMTIVFPLLMGGIGAFVLFRQAAPPSIGAGNAVDLNIGAIERLTAEIATDPQSPDAYLRRGHVYDRAGDYYSAIADYTTAIELGAPPEEAHHARAIARQTTGEYDAALADYDRVLQINPDNASAVLSRGELHSEMGHFEDAASDLALALRLNANIPEIAHELGWARWGTGDYEGLSAMCYMTFPEGPGQEVPVDECVIFEGPLPDISTPTAD